MNKAIIKSTGGTQSVSRALRLLKLIAMHHDEGIELRELVEKTGLERTTTYRLVSSLIETGLVKRDDSKRHSLGVEAMLLGLVAMRRAPILELCKPAMQAIARQTEDTVYLTVRNGDHGHALHREEGSFPIKTFTTIVGGLRLLGLGASCQALLATLSDAEIDALYGRHQRDFESHDLSLLRLQQKVEDIRQKGYTITEGIITPGVCGIGMVFVVSPDSYVGISVAAIQSRMDIQRQKWIVELAKQEMNKLGFPLLSK